VGEPGGKPNPDDADINDMMIIVDLLLGERKYLPLIFWETCSKGD
jgi:hypothetical protein